MTTPRDIVNAPSVRHKRENPDWVDILLAATLAAWGTIVAGIMLFFLAPGIVASPESAGPQALWYVGISIMGFLLASIVCTVIGLPALALANWLKLTKWWQAAIIGGSAGLMLGSPVALYSYIPSYAAQQTPIVGVLFWLFWFVLAGALAGVAAWRERRKPTFKGE